MRIMALDFGEKRIGVAMSDEKEKIAFSKETITRTEESEDLEKIKNLTMGNNVGEIVVGLPLDMDGKEGKSAQNAREFIDKLKRCVQIPVIAFDERLSTSLVERMLIGADVSRKKRKKLSDKLSAQVILQGYLDSKNNI